MSDIFQWCAVLVRQRLAFRTRKIEMIKKTPWSLALLLALAGTIQAETPQPVQFSTPTPARTDTNAQISSPKNAAVIRAEVQRLPSTPTVATPTPVLQQSPSDNLAVPVFEVPSESVAPISEKPPAMLPQVAAPESAEMNALPPIATPTPGNANQQSRQTIRDSQVEPTGLRYQYCPAPIQHDAPLPMRFYEETVPQGQSGLSMLDNDLKPIHAITTEIDQEAGDFPTDYAAARFEQLPQLTHFAGMRREWQPAQFSWEAPGFKHRPLYFEEAMLERHGHHHGPVLGPVISGAHFFSRLPLMPYLTALDKPHCDIYDLGHYRPGSPTPCVKYRVPIQVWPTMAEAGVIAGAYLLFP